MRNKQLSKKGAISLGQLGPAVIIVLAVIITITITGIILDEFSDSTTAGTFARAAVDNGSESVANMSSLLPVIGTVLIAAAVITLVRLFG